MTKRFFYVCAGVFLLAASFQLGVKSASGQSGHRAAVGELHFDVYQGLVAHVVDESGSIWGWSSIASAYGPLPAPKGGTPIALGGAAGCQDVFVLYDDGDIWSTSSCSPEPGTWSLVRNIFGEGATRALPRSWGKVKADYRK